MAGWLAVGVIIPIVGQEMVQSAHQNAGSAQPALELNPTKTRVFCFGQMKYTSWDRICLHPSFYGISLWDGLLLADYRQTLGILIFLGDASSKPPVPWLSMQGMCRK